MTNETNPARAHVHKVCIYGQHNTTCSSTTECSKCIDRDRALAALQPQPGQTARAAARWIACQAVWCYGQDVPSPVNHPHSTICDRVAVAIEQAVEAERERCAGIADAHYSIGRKIAEKIRSPR